MTGLREILIGGGPIVAILILLSLASLTLIVLKILQFVQLNRGQADRDRGFALWADGDRTAAIGLLRDRDAPVDRMLMAAMEGLLAGQSRAALNDDLEWRGNAEIAVLSRNIRLLELIAMVSPLLGLLGTVLGMIQAFQQLALAQGAANASILAGGIWQALLTTAAGLIVAIPAAIAASLLGARVDTAAQRIEAAVGQLFALEDRRR